MIMKNSDFKKLKILGQKKIYLFLLSLFLSSFTLYGQERTVSGTVASSNNETLPGVSVVVKGTNKGTITDSNGKFTIKVDANALNLVFSYLGFTNQEINIAGKSTLNVVLKENASALNEVVVIGYGTVKKSDLTGSVSSLNVESMTKVPTASITQSIAGRTSGITVTSNSGAPGAGVNIRIRGTNSLQGNNDPLFVIDGIPVASSSQQDGNFNADPLSGLNPSDIESMEVLKDASSVAIYGSRGANGVVLITTKSGKLGKAKIAVNSYYGTQSEIKKYDVLSAGEYAQFRNIAVANAGPGFVSYTPQEVADFQASGGTRWRDYLIRDNAAIKSIDASVSGGTEKVNYFVSAGGFGQDGIVNGSGFDRTSLKTTVNVNATSKLKLGSNLSLSQSEYNGAFGNSQNGSFGGGYIDTYSAPPTFPVFDTNGEYYSLNPLSGFPFPNPVENALAITRDQTNLRFLGDFSGEYAITPDLKFKQIFGINYVTNNVGEYAPTFTQRSNNKGSAGQSNSLSRSLLSTSTLNYYKVFQKKHNVSAVLGYELQSDNYQSFGGSSRDFTNDNTGYYSLQSGATISDLSSNYSASGLESFLGRANYNYDGKYFATITGRYDGSSKFQGKNKFSFFPSAALAWRVSKENFLANVKAISDLKLRASYGQTGSQAIPAYRTLDLIGSKNDLTVDGNTTTVGYFPARIANPALKWETTTQYDAGLDLSLFNSRINITADYFHKTTKDLLLDFPLPITTGFNSVLSNAGSIQNKGFDFSVNSRNFSSKDFSWETNLNLSFVRNKVLDIGGRPFIIKAPNVDRAFGSTSYNTGIVRVGKPLGEFYVIKQDGIILTQDELTAAPTYGNIAIGTRRYIDQNADGKITAEDRVVAGNAQPKFTGGFLNSLSYKGFDLSFFFEFSVGNEILNVTRFYLERGTGDVNITREYFNNFVGSPNPNSNNTYPRPNAATGGGVAIDDTYIEDGSYARLKNLTLGYSFTKKAIPKLPFSRVRLYTNLNNMLTLTKYKGLDPNSSVFGGNEFGAGIDYSGYPTAKSVVFGLNFEF